jgi:hypothetical protein
VFPLIPPEPLAGRLGLSPAVLNGLLADLKRAGFAYSDDAATWHATPAGRDAAATGTFDETSLERRTFCFSANGPAFLPFTETGTEVQTDAPPGLLAVLRECVARPDSWKQSHGFPTDVTAILDASVEAADIPSWKRVPVCQAENALLAVIELTDASILGFSVNSDVWTISPEPALRLATRDLVPGLTEPSAETWKQAWREWCQPVRGASPEDVAAAHLEPEAHRLRVRVSPRLLEKLKVSRPEAFRGDGWLLAGDGPVRAAAEVLLDGPTDSAA